MTYDGLRPIDIADRPHVVASLDEIPTLARVPIADLGLDDRYQRPLGPSNWRAITKIAQNFDWKRFTPILVAPAGNGKFAIIDGQHRTHAALMRGYDKVPAMVVAMTVDEQARAFAAVNGDVTAITIFHLYKAALFAQDFWAVKSNEIVREAGCELMPYPVSAVHRKPRQIMQIGLVRDHVEMNRCALFTAGLRAIAECPYGDHLDAYASAVLKPWLSALAALDDWQALNLGAFLEVVNLVKLADHVAAMRKNDAGLKREPASAIYRRTLLAQMRKFIATGSVRPSEAA